MREARAAFQLGGCVQLLERRGKGGSLLLGKRTCQIFIKGRFNLRLGGFQAFRLFRGIEQLAAPVIRRVFADKIALCLQVFRSARNGRLIGMQQLCQRRLRAAGMVAQSVNQVNFRRADALFSQRAQNQHFRLARNFCDFPFRNIHSCLLISFKKMYLHRCMYNILRHAFRICQ